jgi:hypothetical protein
VSLFRFDIEIERARRLAACRGDPVDSEQFPRLCVHPRHFHGDALALARSKPGAGPWKTIILQGVEQAASWSNSVMVSAEPQNDAHGSSFLRTFLESVC